MSSRHRILLAGGGTGGHLMPGLALHDELAGREAVDAVHFLHTDRDLDRSLLSRRNIDHQALTAPRWKGLRRAFGGFAPRFLKALRNCLAFIRSFAPSAVVGLGGYGCVPPGLIAALRGIPLILLEQNVIPGRAVRLLHPHSHLVAAQWRATLSRLQAGRALALGNPIRPLLHSLPDARSARTDLGLPAQKKCLLIMGGSQGAQPLNDWARSCIDALSDERNRLSVIHLAGTDRAERMRDVYKSAELDRHVRDFADRMDRIYAAADLALSRAGGTTLAELMHVRLPAVLVPYPHAVDDHQRHNASVVQSAGGAVVVDSSCLDKSTFRTTVRDLLFRDRRLREMKTGLERLHRPGPARNIADRILSISAGR